MFSFVTKLLKQSPRDGDRKAIMPSPTATPAPSPPEPVAAPPAAPAPAAPPLDPDALGRAIATRLAEAMTGVLQQSGARPALPADPAARTAYIATKMGDLPEVYRQQLSGDPANWSSQEQSIRAQYRADFAAIMAKGPRVDGAAAGGSPPSAAVDISKLNPLQKIELGIRGQKPTVNNAGT